MDISADGLRSQAPSRSSRPLVTRHSVVARLTHWIGSAAFVILVMTGLQVFNAAPYLDASSATDAHRRVLEIDAVDGPHGAQIGRTTIFGRAFTTTGVLGYTDDGSGGRTQRGFPGWATFPGAQDLANGRSWHFFFAWVMSLSGLAYLAYGALRGNLRNIVLRPSDLSKLLPMQLYYLRLRKEPPPHGKYNPLQKMAYSGVLFVLVPFVVLTGLALSPGFDAVAHPVVGLLGGRQFARLWHFVAMGLLLGFLAVHVTLVVSTGFFNNMRSMTTGRYRMNEHEGVGP